MTCETPPKNLTDIPGYEGRYAITRDGCVWSYPKAGTGGHNGKWLTPHPNQCGYLHVVLCKNKNTRTMTVHRLVAKIFIPNPQNKPQVNHINCIKNDNRVGNLEWATSRENTLHAHKNGCYENSAKLTKERCRKLTMEEAKFIRDRYKKGIITQQYLAELFGVSQRTVSEIILNRRYLN